MKKFSKTESKWILIILSVIAFATVVNIRVSLRRARDNDRKNALGALTKALTIYQSDFGFFPPADSNGQLLACKRDDIQDYSALRDDISKQTTRKLEEYFAPCKWGLDALGDVFDANYPSYLPILPQDPQRDLGKSFRYFSDLKNFQIYTALEGTEEDEYDPAIIGRNILCGSVICNSGQSSGATPLDKSLEEYENEIMKNKKR